MVCSWLDPPAGPAFPPKKVLISDGMVAMTGLNVAHKLDSEQPYGYHWQSTNFWAWIVKEQNSHVERVRNRVSTLYSDDGTRSETSPGSIVT